MGAIADGFAAYAQPLIDKTDGSMEQLNKAFLISQLCFNLSLQPEDKRDSMLISMRQALKMDDDEFEDFRKTVVIPMIERHQEMFPRMHNRRQASIDSWEIAPTRPPSQHKITASTEAYPGTDRYAPCPCHSGEKYKFCCGAKSR